MENKFDGKWLICFEFKEMRIITTMDNKIEHFSCIICNKTCSCCTVNLVRTVIPCGPKKGLGVFKCEFTTKRAIHVLIVALDYTQWSESITSKNICETAQNTYQICSSW